MDYDTIIALFTVKIGPLCRLMSVVVDLWKHLFVLVGDYVYAGTFRWRSCCGDVLVCVISFLFIIKKPVIVTTNIGCAGKVKKQEVV